MGERSPDLSHRSVTWNISRWARSNVLYSKGDKRANNYIGIIIGIPTNQTQSNFIFAIKRSIFTWSVANLLPCTLRVKYNPGTLLLWKLWGFYFNGIKYEDHGLGHISTSGTVIKEIQVNGLIFHSHLN